MNDMMMDPRSQRPGKRASARLHHSFAKVPAIETSAMMRSLILAICLSGFLSLSLGFGAVAQDDKARNQGLSMDMPPMPPARPSGLANAPLPAPAPANGPPPGVDPMVADFAPNMLQGLPAASRTRMRECGREWQKIKASGAATDKTWFSFATICLVR